MKIGIIGAGPIGSTLARHLVALGHQVSVANSRGPATLAGLAAETGATAVTVDQAAQAGEVLIVSIPEGAVARLPRGLFDGVPESVVVIDTGNYYPFRDGLIDGIEAGQIESEWVAKRLGRPVIKAFNNILATSLRDGGKPAGTPGRIALSVAGDAAEARSVVLRLVDNVGFDAVDAGSLAGSWRQQPGTPAYCHDLDAAHLTRALAAAERGRIRDYRAASDAHVRKIFADRNRPALSHAGLRARGRRGAGGGRGASASRRGRRRGSGRGGRRGPPPRPRPRSRRRGARCSR
jgi:hypothetical protein